MKLNTNYKQILRLLLKIDDLNKDLASIISYYNALKFVKIKLWGPTPTSMYKTIQKLKKQIQNIIQQLTKQGKRLKKKTT